MESPSNALAFSLQFTCLGGIVAGLVVGAMLGFCNGWAITRFRLPPFVATLGMLSIARGLTMLWTGGFPITSLGDDFGKLGTGYFLGIPMPVCIAAGLIGLFIVVTQRTRFGRYLYAIGGNERAAQLSGIDVSRTKLWVYALGGMLSGVAGLLVAARLDSATPSAGTGYELDSIAAVVIGGTSLSGGRGSIWGTVLGCLIIGVLNNGMVLLQVSPFWQQVVKGAGDHRGRCHRTRKSNRILNLCEAVISMKTMFGSNFLSLAVTIALAVASPRMRPRELDVTGLECEHLKNPLGIAATQPRLSWYQ